ncbi:PTS system sorbose-specific IID component [Lacticaseibacillus paracasei]|nr:PTS system sorbose-specific IID component [Lacticaseibacillus paracasei]
MPHILQDILIIFLASYATLDNQGITLDCIIKVTTQKM